MQYPTFEQICKSELKYKPVSFYSIVMICEKANMIDTSEAEQERVFHDYDFKTILKRGFNLLVKHNLIRAE